MHKLVQCSNVLIAKTAEIIISGRDEKKLRTQNNEDIQGPKVP